MVEKIKKNIVVIIRLIIVLILLVIGKQIEEVKKEKIAYKPEVKNTSLLVADYKFKKLVEKFRSKQIK